MTDELREYREAKLDFARVLRFREGDAEKYLAVNHRLDAAVRALVAAGVDRALARRLPLIAPREKVEQIAAKAEAEAITIAAELLPED
ncbi:MAG: hypothetical protein AMS18_00245 [Gemmatimonas sp. SG8_17]|nr:MAG: hypothetical protein AMS18_00245 [Gemmatimonas sp. SG8_17]